MNLNDHTTGRCDHTGLATSHAGRSVAREQATRFYLLLEKACGHDVTASRKQDILREVFQQVIGQSIRDCRMELVGWFSKVDHCIKEYQIPDAVATLIHDTRKDLFPDARHRETGAPPAAEVLFPHNLKATAFLVHHLCGKEPVPDTLKPHFPLADRKHTWGTFSKKALRVSVERWDETYIWATEEANGSLLKIAYGVENKFLNRDGQPQWNYLKDVLWVGAQLHLVRVRTDRTGQLCMPELIVLEPDYLINITTVASCFETYAESPFVHLVNKLKPPSRTLPVHLGNFSGLLLDNAVHGCQRTYTECFREYVGKNVLNLISCQEFMDKVEWFKAEGIQQKQNIEKIIREDLPESMGGYDRKSVVLEPAYFSPTLGLQGRFDFLGYTQDRVIIIEQKSGKGEFVRGLSTTHRDQAPVAREPHKVQALLYRAICQYELGDKRASQITPMLLYSRYPKGLLSLPPMPSLFLRAMRIRNLLTWCEYHYAKQGMGWLAGLTPEKLNRKKLSGKLWENHVRPQLQALLQPIRQASPLERAYFLRFMRFIANELLLSKVGSKQKEHSGFAAVWNDSLEEKKAAGNIYDRMVIEGHGMEGNAVVSLKLRFQTPGSTDTANFRTGDIVVFYPYRAGELPDACARMVNRASIVEITGTYVELRLRNPQTDLKAFGDNDEGMWWAIEHDMFEANTTTLYAAMHSFLTAPKRRRDLVLLQRPPEVDASIRLKGNYGSFNDLTKRARQARDLFLVIGPPGTGKTSHGLVNLLREELLDPNGNVLLLSYTNRAVDEICDKLMELERNDPSFGFLRIGPELSCPAEHHDHLLGLRCQTAHSTGEVKRMIKHCRVFCATTSAMNAHMALFDLKHFTLAIVDEASQILEPHLIGLLSATRDGREAIEKFVLIGDHRQLPAVVQQPPRESVVTEPELNAIHLKDCRLSLFERLLTQFRTDGGYDERHVYMLTRQGRMHRDIAEFPNEAFYANQLDIVPLQHQTLPCRTAKKGNAIARMLTTHRVVFLATEPPEISSSFKTNPVEAEMIAATVRQIHALTRSCFSVHATIGVIVPYRNQISTVRNAIEHLGIPQLNRITIDTVERFQGSQRDYIVYGFTVQQPWQLDFLTNNVFKEGDAVIDRKLNVVMTRARLGLIMLGNPRLLDENPTFHKLMEFVRSKGGYFSVPAKDYCTGNFNV